MRLTSGGQRYGPENCSERRKALEILTHTENVDREREDGISDQNTQGLPVSFSDNTYLVDGRRKSQGVFRKGHSGKTF